MYVKVIFSEYFSAEPSTYWSCNVSQRKRVYKRCEQYKRREHNMTIRGEADEKNMVM